MLILLPPSEGKAVAEPGPAVDLAALALPPLRPAREHVIDALAALCRQSDRQPARTVLGLGPTQDAEIDKNTGLMTAPAIPAERLYTGVLYDALELGTLPVHSHELARQAIVVFSGLWGVLRIDDRVPAYRCPIGANLPGIGGLAPYWRRSLSQVLPQLADGPVLDLRSGAYAAAWTPAGDLAGGCLAVRVLHERMVGGVLTRSVVSHFNKATKGRLVRDLLLGGIQPTTASELVTALRDLKYQVQEPASPPTRPRRLDVIVAEL